MTADTPTPLDRARDILAANRYAVLATANADGEPWVSPVYFAYLDLDMLLWLSYPDSQHSRWLEQNPRIAVTVFDSTVGYGAATAFYARGVAGLCPPADLAARLAVYSARSVSHGIQPWTPAQVTGDAGLRLYQARLSDAWILHTGEGRERRIPVTA